MFLFCGCFTILYCRQIQFTRNWDDIIAREDTKFNWISTFILCLLSSSRLTAGKPLYFILFFFFTYCYFTILIGICVILIENIMPWNFGVWDFLSVRPKKIFFIINIIIQHYSRFAVAPYNEIVSNALNIQVGSGYWRTANFTLSRPYVLYYWRT